MVSNRLRIQVSEMEGWQVVEKLEKMVGLKLLFQIGGSVVGGCRQVIKRLRNLAVEWEGSIDLFFFN